MPSANQRIVYTPWSPGLQASWTVAGVRCALSQHEQGQFSSSSKLVDALGRDDRLSAVIATRMAGLFGRDFSVDPADGEEADDAGKAIAEDVEERWFHMFPEATLIELWTWRLLMGFAIGELRWVYAKDAWVPTLHAWHPQFVYHDDERECYVVQTQQGPIDVPQNGGDGKWIVFGRGARPWMNGLVRCLAVPWLVAQFALRDWARYSERHGMPIVKAMVPSRSDEDDKAAFIEDIKTMSTETTVQLPTGIFEDGSGFDLELLEATDRSWQGFQGLLSQIYDTYAISLTGNNLTTMISGGSYAAAKEGGAVRNDYAEADGAELSTQIREQGVKPFVLFNHASGEDRIPWPKWHTSPPEDLKLNAETMKALGEALGALKTGGAKVINIEELGEKYGVELEEKEAMPIPPAFAAQQPGAPPFPPKPADVDEEEDEDEELKANMKLASGDALSTAPGFVAGQMHVDSLTEDGIRKTRRHAGIDLRDVLEVIESSTDYPDLRVRLRNVFGGMDPEPFAALMEKALILSELTGRHAALEDV